MTEPVIPLLPYKLLPTGNNMKKVTLPHFDIREIIDKLLSKLRLISTVFAIIFILFFGWFLYENFYKTIISAQEVTDLKAQVAQVKLNTKNLNYVIEMYNKKMAIPDRNWSQFSSILTSVVVDTTDQAEDSDDVSPGQF